MNTPVEPNEDECAADAHMREVFASDFRYLAEFVAGHLGDESAIKEVISQMAAYRLASWNASMIEIYQTGEAVAEARAATAAGGVIQ